MIRVRNSRPTADTVRVVGTARKGLIPLHSLAVVAESAVAIVVANFGLRIGCSAIAASRQMFKDKDAAHRWLLARSRLHALDVRRAQNRPQGARHVQWPS